MKNILYAHKTAVTPLFILLCILALISENSISFLLHMGALLLHEGAHNIMARMLGCNISKIKLLPYGCRMDLCNLDSPWDEFMIALTGPVFSLICYMGCRTISGAEEFAKANMYIALMNLLPVYPLDGGRAVDSLFSMFGFKMPYILQVAVTFSFAALIGVCGYLIKNATVIIFSIFLFSEGLSATRKQGRAVEFYIKNMRCSAAGRGLKVQHIALHKDVAISTALSYGFGRYVIFCILNDNMREIARADITTITEFAVKYGSSTPLGDIIPYIDRSKY